MGLRRSLSRLAIESLEEALGRVSLRGATGVGPGTRVFGWPRVENQGELLVGRDVTFVATPAAIELRVLPGASLVIGARALIESGVLIRAVGAVRIGRGVRIGAGCVIDGEAPGGDPYAGGVSIGEGAWLENGVILHGGAEVPPGTVIRPEISAFAPRSPRSEGQGFSDEHASGEGEADFDRRLRAVLSRVVAATSTVEPDAELTTVRGWDSLAALRALVALEREFSIVLPVNLFAERPSLAAVKPIIAARVARHASQA
jgi:acyl carrier protein